MASPSAVDPMAANASMSQVQEVERTWNRATRVWWAIVWRSLLAAPLAGVVGCVIGFFIGMVGHVAGIDVQGIRMFSQVVGLMLGLVIGVPVGIWATRRVLHKQFREFRIALLPRGV